MRKTHFTSISFQSTTRSFSWWETTFSLKETYKFSLLFWQTHLEQLSMQISWETWQCLFKTSTRKQTHFRRNSIKSTRRCKTSNYLRTFNRKLSDFCSLPRSLRRTRKSWHYLSRTFHHLLCNRLSSSSFKTWSRKISCSKINMSLSTYFSRKWSSRCLTLKK